MIPLSDNKASGKPNNDTINSINNQTVCSIFDQEYREFLKPFL